MLELELYLTKIHSCTSVSHSDVGEMSALDIIRSPGSETGVWIHLKRLYPQTIIAISIPSNLPRLPYD